MRAYSYYKLGQSLHKSAEAKRFPLRVMFELTYKCNFLCRHCYVPFHYRKKKELKTKDVYCIIDQLTDIGCLYLGFTGGEPLVRKDTLKIIRYACNKGFEVIIYTNGSLLDGETVQELSCLRLNKIDITIPAMSEAAFEKITGVNGSHKKVFRAIELLHKNKVALGFKTCLLKENEAEIDKIKDFAASLKALHRLDTVLSRRLDGSGGPYKYRGQLNEKYNIEDNESRDENCNLKQEEPNIEINLFDCGAGTRQAAITPLGELKMCLMLGHPRYKILNSKRETRLRSAWDKLQRFAASIKIDKYYKCGRCSLRLYCKWCPAKAWLYNKRFTSCVPELKKYYSNMLKSQTA